MMSPLPGITGINKEKNKQTINRNSGNRCKVKLESVYYISIELIRGVGGGEGGGGGFTRGHAPPP